MQYTFYFPNSLLSTVIMNLEPYKAGHVTFIFKQQTYLEPLITSLQEQGANPVRLFNLCIINDIAFINNSILDLLAIRYITYSDFSILIAVKRKVDEALEQRQKASCAIEPGQINILESVSQIFIDDIIESSVHWDQAMMLLKSAFYSMPPEQNLDLKMALLNVAITTFSINYFPRMPKEDEKKPNNIYVVFENNQYNILIVNYSGTEKTLKSDQISCDAINLS